MGTVNCPKDCIHHNEKVIARRWFKGKEAWTGYCEKYKRLVLCYDLGNDGTGAKFRKCDECIIYATTHPESQY